MQKINFAKSMRIVDWILRRQENLLTLDPPITRVPPRYFRAQHYWMLAAVWMLFPLTACTAEPSSGEMTIPNVATIRADMRVISNELILEYDITNTGDDNLFVIDVSIVLSPQGASVQPGVPRVELLQNRHAFLLSRLHQIDHRIHYATPPMSYADLLLAGATKKSAIRLRLPLLPSNLPPSREVQEIKADDLTLIIGVVPSLTVPSAREQLIAGTRVWRLPPDAWQFQKELKVSATVPNISVLTNK